MSAHRPAEAGRTAHIKGKAVWETVAGQAVHRLPSCYPPNRGILLLTAGAIAQAGETPRSSTVTLSTVFACAAYPEVIGGRISDRFCSRRVPRGHPRSHFRPFSCPSLSPRSSVATRPSTFVPVTVPKDFIYSLGQIFAPLPVMKHLPHLILTLLILLSNSPTASSQRTVGSIDVPPGFSRVEAGGFGAYLRALPLKPAGSVVRLCHGRPRSGSGVRMTIPAPFVSVTSPRSSTATLPPTFEKMSAIPFECGEMVVTFAARQ